MTGTRYKRRGVDEDGNTANYVETEQVSHPDLLFVVPSWLKARGGCLADVRRYASLIASCPRRLKVLVG